MRLQALLTPKNDRNDLDRSAKSTTRRPQSPPALISSAISQDGVDNRAQLAHDSAHSDLVALAFRALLFVVGAEHRVKAPSAVGRNPEIPAQIRRTAL